MAGQLICRGCGEVLIEGFPDGLPAWVDVENASPWCSADWGVHEPYDVPESLSRTDVETWLSTD